MNLFDFRILAPTVFLAIMSLALSPARADPCDETLVISTLRDSRQLSSDRRLAVLIDRENYSAIRNSAGVSAVIYGIPVGANYEQFSENRQRVFASFAESHRIDAARDIAWTGLDPQSSALYLACQQARIAMSNGVSLIVSSATSTNYLIQVIRRLPGLSPSARLSWSQPSIQTPQGPYTLPTNIGDGMTQISLPRPVADTAIALNVTGWPSQGIVLRPLAPAIPPPTARPTSQPVTVQGITGAYAAAVFDDAPGSLRLRAILRAHHGSGGQSNTFSIIWGVASADGQFSPQASQPQSFTRPDARVREQAIDLTLRYTPPQDAPRSHLPISVRVMFTMCHLNFGENQPSRDPRDTSSCEINGTLSMVYD